MREPDTYLNTELDPKLVQSTEPMEWLCHKLEWGRVLRAWVPDGFERYVRVLHPAYTKVWKEQDVLAEVPVPWSAVSAWSGNPLHATSSIRDLRLRSDGLFWSQGEAGGSDPLEGQLGKTNLSDLLKLLVTETTTPEEIWMLVWIGYGDLPNNIGYPVEINSSLTGSGRKYVLLRASISSSLGELQGVALEHPPSFWWPADHSWFVVCDIDASSTYVGGSDTLIGRILSSPDLETFPAELNDPYDGGSN